MTPRNLVIAGAAGVGLLTAAWQLVVPAQLHFGPAALPPPAATVGCAAVAVAVVLAFVTRRARGGAATAGLPLQAAAVAAVATAAAGIGLFAAAGQGGFAARAAAATAAAGFAVVLAPAAAVAVHHAIPRRTGGPAVRLSTLVIGTIVIMALGSWLLFGAAVVYHADAGPARGGFVLVVAALAAAAVASVAILAWAIARAVRRDLLHATAAVAALGAADRDEAPSPTRAAAADETGDLALATSRLRERLGREREAHTEALARSHGADQAREEFLRVVSHELRTPLNAICGYSQLLLEGLDGPLPPEAADDVHAILESGRQLSALVDDVVDLAMLTSGRPALKLDALDLGALVAEVARTHSSLTRDRPVALEVEVAADLPVVRADRKRVRQVVTNLLANALKFTDAGRVRIAARRAADRADAVEVEISDTGVGIAEHELPGLFDEFKQGSNIGSKRRQGAGLGLAICRRLVELHGGRISAASRPNEGATFVVALPVAGPVAGAPS